MTRIQLVHRNSLSCEAIVRRMPNGELLMVSQCDGPIEPHPDNRVYYWHSRDDGASWEGPVRLWPEDGRAVYQTEVSVRGEEVTVYVTLHNGMFWDWDCVMLRSTDSGHTWEMAGYPPCFRQFVFHRGMIETSDGGIVMAYQRYPVTEEQNRTGRAEGGGIYKRWDMITHNENGITRSDDNGKTWNSYPVITLQHDRIWHWGEPTVCELRDGRLAMLVRVNGSGYLTRSDSSDGGRTWCEPYRTDIPNPGNKVKLIGMPDGKIALLHTPTIRKMRLTDRHPLEIWISDDDMRSWGYKRTLIDMPGAISYPDGFCSEDGKHVCLSIEFNRHDVYYIDHEVE